MRKIKVDDVLRVRTYRGATLLLEVRKIGAKLDDGYIPIKVIRLKMEIKRKDRRGEYYGFGQLRTEYLRSSGGLLGYRSIENLGRLR